jgi:amino acid permease
VITYVIILIVTIAMTACAGWLLVRDIQKQETGAFFFSIKRKDSPVGYWSFILIWLAVFLFCLLVASAFAGTSLLMMSDNCDDNGKCEVTVSLDPA